MDTDCPCGSGATYAACCGPLHSGSAAAATAEQLMRSRYSAFTVGDTDYLLATWHPATRPASVDLDPAIQWQRLRIRGLTAGTENDEAIRQHIDITVTSTLPSVTAENLASWSPEQRERHVEQLEQVTKRMTDVIDPLVERAGEHITEVALFRRRLAIRRGPDDPVTKDLEAVVDALQARLDAIMAQPHMVEGTDRASELEADATEARSRGYIALAKYATHARELVGARLKE